MKRIARRIRKLRGRLAIPLVEARGIVADLSIDPTDTPEAMRLRASARDVLALLEVAYSMANGLEVPNE